MRLVTIICTAIAILGWAMQSVILSNWDVSWLMEASNRLLHGGTYAKDFFENNPPLILYEYTIPNLIKMLFHLNVMAALRLFVFGLGGISLYLCYIFSKAIFVEQDQLLANCFLITISILFFILPADQFGQRDHLLFIFSMPYFLMMTLRSQQQSIKSAMAYGVGAFAALGFLLKPYFLPTLILIELYHLLVSKQKNWASIIRPEIISIACLSIVYISTILVFHRDYLFIVLPYAIRWCRLGDIVPWAVILQSKLALFSLIPLLVFFLQDNPYKKLYYTLILALIGFLISYYEQRTFWYYHIIPAFSLALLIFMLFFSTIASKPLTKINGVLVLLSSSLIALLLIDTAGWTQIILSPFSYYSYFALLFFIFMLLDISLIRKNIKQTIYAFCFFNLMLLFVFMFSKIILKTASLTNHLFFIATITLVLSLFFIMQRLSDRPWSRVFVLSFGLLAFYYPYNLIVAEFETSFYHKENLSPLIDFLDHQGKQKSIYFLTPMMEYIYPVINYSNNQVASKFEFPLGLSGIMKQYNLPFDPFRSPYQEEDENFLIDMIADDLNQKKPDLIFIDAKNQKKLTTIPCKKDSVWRKQNGVLQERLKSFDYIYCFSKNARFKSAWTNYRYMTTVKQTNPKSFQYQFYVYKRISR